MITPRKVLNMLASPRPLHKVWVALNSTPLQTPLKKMLELAYFRERSMRRSLARTMPADPLIQTHVDAIHRDGYSIADPVMNRSLLQKLHDASIALVQRANNAEEYGDSHFAKKPFWSRLL